MLNAIIRVIVGFVLVLLLANNVDAQSTSWSAQGPSGCSDQYGSFDAFIPGMRGAGSCTRGGFVPGTNVIVVSNTNATGSGSLDAASNAACPKVVLFAVSGLINRAGQVNFNCDGWSIVGASSPGQITLAGGTGSPLLATQHSKNFTVDHLTIAAGDTDVQPGGLGNRDSVGIGTGGDTGGPGVFANITVLWGGDEVFQCYPPQGSEVTNMLLWQSIVARPVAGSGSHIIQNTCINHSSIRNFYIHSHGRNPMSRVDGFLHANSFTANPGYQSGLIQPCDGAYTPVDSNVRQNWINNLMARGNNSSSHSYIQLNGGSTCTDFQIYESGTHVMQSNFSIQNCTNHNCTSGIAASDFVSSPITAVYPAGFVPETITNSQVGYIAFAQKIIGSAGSHPLNRLPLVQTLAEQGINHVDGSGERGGWGASQGYPSNAVGLESVAAQGGLAAVTQSASSYDPTSGADNPCGEDMPTGAAADEIQSSGLTRLHEWVIGCFYDNVMPGGYREDGLENYGAPGGGASGPPAPPPPPLPNPPENFG